MSLACASQDIDIVRMLAFYGAEVKQADLRKLEDSEVILAILSHTPWQRRRNFILIADQKENLEFHVGNPSLSLKSLLRVSEIFKHLVSYV